VLHPTEVDHHANGWIRYAPDLMIRPVAWIVQELPPRPKSYHVTLLFRATTTGVLAIVRSTGKTKSKKPIGERALGLVAA